MAGISRDGRNRFNATPQSRFGGGQNFSPQNAYSQAIPQQAQDYDEIMQGYRGIVNDPGGDQAGIMSGYRNLMNNSKDFEYKEAPEMQRSFGVLDDLQTTGGLSDQDKQDLRARGTSPIRAIYDNMSKKMDRNRTLGGGYSPSYNASASRMAREGSEAISGGMQNVNAGIAEMVQKGKLSGAGMYAGQAAGKNTLMNEMIAKNAQNKGNILSGWQGAQNAMNNNKQGALQGMTSLYGTTPALVNTFGQQVMQQGQMQENAVANKRQNKLGAFSGYSRGR